MDVYFRGIGNAKSVLCSLLDTRWVFGGLIVMWCAEKDDSSLLARKIFPYSVICVITSSGIKIVTQGTPLSGPGPQVAEH